jgi:hypothetical protein
LIMELTAKDAVQPTQHLPRVICTRKDGLQGYLDHCGDERGWDAVSGHVSHQDSNSVLINGNEIIKISSDGCHRTINGDDAQVFEFRTAAWKD